MKASGSMDGFGFVSYAQEVIFAAGALARLGEATGRSGWQRLMLCTNRSMRDSGHLAAVEAQLGERLAVIFDEAHPHVPDIQVEQAAALASEKGVDAVIGLGGGSPIGLAKATAFRLEQIQTGQAGAAAFPTQQPSVPVIAIPTTYAGSEMTPVYGITYTRETPPRKVTVNDPRITPKLVVYDPLLTIDLPAAMTASTGINALAHCVEAAYSLRRNPLSTAAAVSGAGHIYSSLYRCYIRGDDLEARTEMLTGAHLAGLSLASVSMALHHGLCHVLGGSANVPHGIANSIILPYAIRFNASATASLLQPLAAAMGISTDGRSLLTTIESMAQSIYDLVGKMGLPQRLRQAGVRETDLPAIALLAFQNRSVQNNPRPITDPQQIEALLKEAW